MPTRLILELGDDAIAAIGITPDELPHGAASFVELMLAEEVLRRGGPNGSVAVEFFVPEARRTADAILRRARGATPLRQFAEEHNLTHSTLSEVENGRSNLTLNRLEGLAERYGVRFRIVDDEEAPDAH